MDKGNTWLPQCLSHLNQPYLTATDEFVVIGELSSEPCNGYIGYCQVHTVLVPLKRLKEVLAAPGGIGWEVEAWGPCPVVEEGEIYKTDFWVRGPAGEGDKLEPLVLSWARHNKTVLMPDNGLLMCYGLCPRTQKNPDKIIWDDLSKPEYDVISIMPLSHYDVTIYSKAQVRINRQYLEDYASLKGCAVVAVFYEQRWCSSDDELGKLLGEEEGKTLKVSGREIEIMHIPYNKETPILCKIWGCRLVLIPSGRPVSEGRAPALEWPGFSGAIAYKQAMSKTVSDYVYISDQVLEQFEDKPEYVIHPETGSVSYNGWWSLSFCHRISRDYIAYEIKKIYEGCPPSIIRHVHRYAVSEEIAVAQKKVYGDNHIGKRAKTLIEKFLELGGDIAELGDPLGFAFQDADIITLSKGAVRYSGWWTHEKLKPLGYRAAINMTKGQFLERCKTIYQLFEGLKEKPLRRMLIQIGLKNEQIENLRSMKLLATLLQICEISHEAGLSITKQKKEIVSRWDPDVRLEELRPLFALIDLRNAAGHNLGSEEAEKIRMALKVFELDESCFSSGWGLALDRVYDVLNDTIEKMTEKVRFCILET